MTWLSFGLNLVAFLLFGVATDAHHRAFLGLRPDRRRTRVLRIAAWLLVGASVIPAFVDQGAIRGGIVWSALVMAGAASAFLLLHGIGSRRRRRTIG